MINGENFDINHSSQGNGNDGYKIPLEVGQHLASANKSIRFVLKGVIGIRKELNPENFILSCLFPAVFYIRSISSSNLAHQILGQTSNIGISLGDHRLGSRLHLRVLEKAVLVRGCGLRNELFYYVSERVN